MARCDVLYFEVVVKGGHDFLDVCITRHNEVKPASNDVDARIDGGRRCNDLVDTGVRATDYDGHALRRIDGQGQFPQFECSRFVGNKGNQVDVGSNFGVFVDELKDCTWPGGSKFHGFGRV